MRDLLSKTQNAFIQGIQILDYVFIADEYLDVRIEGIPGMLCKLDLEQSYVHVNYDFFLYMLRRCGFGEKWMKGFQELTYCVVSDLKINLGKLEISLVIEVVNLEELAPLLDIRHLTFH